MVVFSILLLKRTYYVLTNEVADPRGRGSRSGGGGGGGGGGGSRSGGGGGGGGGGSRSGGGGGGGGGGGSRSRGRGKNCSPARWKILQQLTEISLHKLSDTRWSARIAAVKPIAKQPREIITALNFTIENLDLTADMLNQAESFIMFFKSFETFVLLTFWYKVLQVVDEVSRLFQSSSLTIDNGVILIQQLISNLCRVRSSWNNFLTKAKAVAGPLGFQTEFLTKRKKRAKRYYDEVANAAFCYESPEHYFKENIFKVALNHFIYQVKSRFDIVKFVNVLLGENTRFKDQAIPAK
nr:keratin, type II cytoskeletal 1-like [Hydra vulgaris]